MGSLSEKSGCPLFEFKWGDNGMEGIVFLFEGGWAMVEALL